MDVIFVGGMIDRKLISKIIPIQKSGLVKKIYLIRRTPFHSDKIVNISPPLIIRKVYVLSELYRFLSIAYLLIFKKIDCLIAAGFMPHAIYTTIFGSIFKKKCILLLMGQIEINLSFPIKGIINNWFINLALKSNYIGVRGSDSAKKLIRHGYDKNKIFIANNLFDFNSFIPINLEKEYDLIFVGNFHPEKRLDLLLEIIDKVLNCYHFNIKVLLVGKGKMFNEILCEVNRKKLYKNVYFHDFTYEKELEMLLNKSKILALTSEFEGLPMVLVEAFSCGIPAIAFNVADIKDVLKNEYNGYLIDFGNITDYCLKLINLLQDSVLYDKMTRNCLQFRNIFKEMYSLECITKNWNSIFNKIQS